MTNKGIIKIFIIVIICFVQALFAQNYTINGLVIDKDSKEIIPDSRILVPFYTIETHTGVEGKYSLTVPQTDTLTIIVSHSQYKDKSLTIYLKADTTVNVELESKIIQLDKMVVTGKSTNIQKAEMGTVELTPESVKKMPVILGETDVLKAVQLAPGVQSGNEGTAEIFVRGGNADQNLMLLDGAVIYNPNHLLGLFSTFNSDIIDNVTLIKGGFPAQYGGRLSSILNVGAKTGDDRKSKVHGGIGLISSRLSVEGPIKKDKASVILSARRTIADLLVRPVMRIFVPENESTYYFYDVNTQLQWKLSGKDHLFLTGYAGKDNAKIKPAKGLDYGLQFHNSAAVIRWKHLFGEKIISNLNIIYSGYDQNIKTIQHNTFNELLSSIYDIRAKLAFDFSPTGKHHIKLGADAVRHFTRSSGNTALADVTGETGSVTGSSIPSKKSDEAAGFLTYEFTPSEYFSTNIGVRIPGFTTRDTTYYKVEPRLTTKVSFDPRMSIKASYAEMNQFIHTVNSTTATIPTDLMIASSRETKPQLSRQYSLGYFHNFFNGNLETVIEGYYKTMENQVLFKEGNVLQESTDLEQGLVYGKGWSYGMELQIRKIAGSVTGWLSYTLSKTDQLFADLNFGKIFPFRYDRRHVLSMIGFYDVNETWSLSAAFSFSSGTAYTLPVGRFNVVNGGSLFEGNYFVYEERNNARLEPFHRLDISATHKNRRERSLFGRKIESEWVFGIFNVYSNRNPYFVFYEIDPITNQPTAQQVSLLPILPSVTYNLRF